MLSILLSKQWVGLPEQSRVNSAERQRGPSVAFEACEESGPWTFNFSSPAVLRQNQWSHVAAVVKQGAGVIKTSPGERLSVRFGDAPPVPIGADARGRVTIPQIASWGQEIA